MGAGNGANNNYLLVTGPGSILTNTGAFNLAGTSAGGSDNRVTVVNGGRLINIGSFYNGYIGTG